MKKANLSWLFIINIFLLVAAVISLARPNLVESAAASHVVISEVQLDGGTSTDEFIEIYNPTASAVNISSWTVSRKTSAASPDPANHELLATIPASTSIASHSYYLIAHNDYDGTPTEDLIYTGAGSLSTNNSIYLKNSSNVVIDKLGLGTNNDPETNAKTNPSSADSVERKANSSSTTATMIAADALLGNAEDTDDNSADFVNRASPEPQNSQSAPEDPTGSPAPSTSSSPAASASASPSSSPSASPSATPSASASASPSTSPSSNPSSTPSGSPSASPSASASASPNVSPSTSPSVSPSASASASASPSHTPQPSVTPKPRRQLVCKFETRTLNFGWFKITFPDFTCSWKTI
jgi:hypothetical protein